MERFRPVEETL